MSSPTGLEIAGVVAESGVAIFTATLAWGTFGLARSGDRSAAAAAKLYDLQLADMQRRENAERPNLQLFDVRPVPMQPGDPPQLMNRTLIVELMNFGTRPARISTAVLYARPDGEASETIRALDSPVVQGQDIVRCEIGAAVAKWFQRETIRALQQADPVGSAAVPGVPNAILEISYSEVGGSGLRTERFEIDLNTYRPQFNVPECRYRIVRRSEPQ